MTIKSIDEKKQGKIEIDLTGPDGNAYALMGYAIDFARQLGKNNEDEIIARMKEGNYEHLIQVFDEEFGDFVTLYR